MKLGFLMLLLALTTTIYAKEILVSSEPEFTSALQKAVGGDMIVWKAGEYQNVKLNFVSTAAVSATNPIVFKAEQSGKVIFSGNSQLFFGGSYLQAEGFTFSGTCSLKNGESVVTFAPQGKSSQLATHCRVTNCAIINYTPIDVMVNQNYIELMGAYNEVDHCSFIGKTNQGPYLVVRYQTDKSFVAGSDAAPSSFHHIHHNYFGYRTLPSDNGGEDMRIGDSRTSFTHGFNIIEYNYFEDHHEEAEVISNKSWNNLYRYNTFINDDGALVLRHGQQCIAYGNYFDGGSGRGVSGGLRVINSNQTVFNNYMEHLEGGNKPLKAPICIMSGIEKSEIFEYFAADSAIVAYNTVVNSVGPAIRIGTGNKAKGSAYLPPKELTIVGNLFINTVSKDGAVVVIDQEGYSFATTSDNLYTNGNSNNIKGVEKQKESKLIQKNGWYYAATTPNEAIIKLINQRLARHGVHLTDAEITQFNPAWKLKKTDVGVGWKW